MKYVRNSVLRRNGQSRTANVRNRLRRVQKNLASERQVSSNLLDTIGQVRTAVSTVSVPNGTTRKVTRILSEAI